MDSDRAKRIVEAIVAEGLTTEVAERLVNGVIDDIVDDERRDAAWQRA